MSEDSGDELLEPGSGLGEELLDPFDQQDGLLNPFEEHPTEQDDLLNPDFLTGYGDDFLSPDFE